MLTDQPLPLPELQPLCRSDYYADTGRRQDHNDRVVRCNLPLGHPGEHDELVDGEPGVVTWPCRPEPQAAPEALVTVPASRVLPPGWEINQLWRSRNVTTGGSVTFTTRAKADAYTAFARNAPRRSGAEHERRLETAWEVRAPNGAPALGPWSEVCDGH